MITDVRLVRKMFRDNVHYVVPRFQRHYVWTVENWKSMWDDVAKVARRDSNGRGANGHFLGAVVLEEQPSPNSNTDVYLVVDGQQRLTTLQLLIAAARDVATTLRLDTVATAFGRLCVNEDVNPQLPKDLLKVWPTRRDLPAFQLAMTESSQALRTRFDPPQSTIMQAYLYFVDRITHWVGRPNEDQSEAFRRLVDVLNASLHAVVIELDIDDNPQAIFESLNARGLPLQASDLVRNYVFRIAEERSLDASDLYAQYWERFDDGRWREETTRGQVTYPHMDAFLTDFLWVELRDQVPTQQIFLTFRNYVDEAVSTMSLTLPELMSRVADYGAVYHSLEWAERGELSDFENEFLTRFKALGIASVMPVLLHVFVQYGRTAREQVLRHLDSYLWRRAAVGLPADRYGELSLALLKVLDDAGSDPGQATCDFLAAQSAESNFWPSDEDVRTTATARPFDRIKSLRIRHLLAAVNSWLRNNESEDLGINPTSLTLEHLMPQAWRETDWPLRGTSRRDRDRAIHTLGNLTLLTGRLNSRTGNGPWTAKRTEILKSSKLDLNLHLPEVWDERAIDARGQQFVDLLLRSFPRPAAAVNGAESPDPAEEEDDGVTSSAPDSTPAIDSLPTAGSAQVHGLVRSVAGHILEALREAGPNEILTVSQLAKARTSHYDGDANPNTIRARLKRDNVSAVEATTNAKGHMAARLAPQLASPRTLAEAASRLQSPATASPLERRLTAELRRMCGLARSRAGYPLTGLLALINIRGGLPAAKQILSESRVSDVFVALVQRGHLDLTVESVVLRAEFATLFTEAEKAIAAARIQAATQA